MPVNHLNPDLSMCCTNALKSPSRTLECPFPDVGIQKSIPEEIPLQKWSYKAETARMRAIGLGKLDSGDRGGNVTEDIPDIIHHRPPLTNGRLEPDTCLHLVSPLLSPPLDVLPTIDCASLGRMVVLGVRMHHQRS